ncbi:MAG: alanine--glyoxylate aminotransferase family protein [Armatimonadota bacterium]|nr:alanine--glyoxylate aminotransferase family protein [Armatimonadota bacterium]
MRQYLLIPGPTPLPDDVLEASSWQMVNHRGPEFGRLFAETLAGLRRVFMTRHPVLAFTSSGTGGLEAAVVNLCSPGDTIIAASSGWFGERFGEIGEAFGVHVVWVKAPWGQVVDPEAVRAALAATPRARAVLVAQSETSTGVRQDVAQIAAFVRGTPTLMVVDGISSVGAMELRTDEWGIDVVIAGSQKALMAPPGLSLISVSDKAWAAVAASRLPKFYWSFERMRKDLGETEATTPFTPAISVVHALRVGIQRIEAEGLEACYERHRRTARAVRAGIRALGLEIVPREEDASETVTAVRLPEGVGANALLDRLRTEHGVVLAGGMGQFQGKIFRFGHLGWVSEDAVLAGLRALEVVLSEFGVRVGGGAVAAAKEVLAGARVTGV